MRQYLLKNLKLKKFKKKLTEKLEESNHLWKETFDAIQDDICIIDENHKILKVNKAAKEHLKLPLNKIINKKCYEVIHKTKEPPIKCCFDKVKNTLSPIQFETYDIIRKRPIEVYFGPLTNPETKKFCLVHVIKDISERKIAEQIIKEDRNRFKEIAKTNEKKYDEAMRKFSDARRLSDIGMLAATIAHEIRNPLAAIKIAAYNIKRKTEKEDISRHVANIDKKVIESDLIIRNLLSYSRVKSPVIGNCDIIHILKDAIDSVKQKNIHSDILLRTYFQKSINTNIEADAVHLRILFTNIADNAYQALEGKGTVSISLKREEDVFKISCSDTGIGIDQKDISRIFAPFFTGKPRGVGLGLAVCKQIVDGHRGKIKVLSKKHKGTKVYIELPAFRGAETYDSKRETEESFNS